MKKTAILATGVDNTASGFTAFGKNAYYTGNFDNIAGTYFIETMTLNTGSLSGALAIAIDAKLDDGRGSTGKVFACTNDTLYGILTFTPNDESTACNATKPENNCGLLIDMQGD